MPPKKTKKSSRTIEERFQKKSQREHILIRPDSYIGSVSLQEEKLWIYNSKCDKIVEKEIIYSPGLYKIFDEIAVNAGDRVQEDDTCNKIEFNIDQETNTITVKNNGHGLEIVEHQEHKIYVPTLIFGHLLTGSNFNDEEDVDRTTGGRNGFGAKLANIYSTEFTIETIDAERKLKFVQTFRDNMSIEEKAKITKLKSANPISYTKISFVPDLARFGMTRLSNDMISLFTKRAYDFAGVYKHISVSVNDVKIKFSNFKSYIEKYKFTAEAEGETGELIDFSNIMYHDSERWQVGVVYAPDQSFKQVSFVNGICTYHGGTHVNHVVDAIVDKIKAAILKKQKKMVIKPQTIKDHLIVFVNAIIAQPNFTSQVKETLKTKVSDFGSKCEFTPKFLKSVTGCGVVDHVIRAVQLKDENKITKGVKKTSKGVNDIIKLEDAAKAGTAKSQECTLILTEGDSAKALAVAGLKKVAAEFYGVFPLKGKLLNVREALSSQIAKNEEIQNICRILGLKIGKKYESTKELRYGRLVIMTDQDTDGFHIKGLILNFIHYFWPSLLKLNNFIFAFQTPVLKAFKGKQVINFFSIPDYIEWKETSTGNWKLKYYKGLGTSTVKEAEEYFSNIDNLLTAYINDEICDDIDTTDKADTVIMNTVIKKTKKAVKVKDDDDSDDETDLTIDNKVFSSKYGSTTTESITLAFEKPRADDRKIWLKKDPDSVLDYNDRTVSIPDFINKEMKLFSREDCERSIPSICDGFKPSQRKILHTMYSRKMFTVDKEKRVSEVASLIVSEAAYHHGEMSLVGAIIKMAQDFVGAQNINLLVPSGIFGSRLMGGSDAAAPRYIHTYIEPISQLLFKAVDTNVLNYLDDNGKIIEPEYFLPVLPIILINGTNGIGTGWSSFIPKFSPIDIGNIFKARLDNIEPNYDIKPWYRGFTGSVLKSNTPGTFLVYGKYQIVNETTIRITEIPIGSKQTKWVSDYKAFLTDLEKNKTIISVESNVSGASPIFTVTMDEDVLSKWREKKEIYKKFKLVNKISTSQMNLYDANNEIKNYKNIKEICDDFYDIRMELYVKRKLFLINKFENDILIYKWKMQFINDVINKKIIVFRKKRTEVINKLLELGYPRLLINAKKNRVEDQVVEIDVNTDADQEEDMESTSDGASYDYLTSMKLFQFTEEKIAELQKQLDEKLDELNIIRETSEEKQWSNEIDMFIDEFNVWVDRVPETLDTVTSGKRKAKRTKKATTDMTKKTKKAVKRVKKIIKES